MRVLSDAAQVQDCANICLRFMETIPWPNLEQVKQALRGVLDVTSDTGAKEKVGHEKYNKLIDNVSAGAASARAQAILIAAIPVCSMAPPLLRRHHHLPALLWWHVAEGTAHVPCGQALSTRCHMRMWT